MQWPILCQEAAFLPVRCFTRQKKSSLTAPSPHPWQLWYSGEPAGALTTKGTIRKKQIYLKLGENTLLKNEVLKRWFPASHSPNRTTAVANDTREGKTEGSCQRLAEKAVPQLEADSFSLPVCCFRIPGYSARRSNTESLPRKQRQTEQCPVLPFYDITFQPPLQKVKVKVTQSCLTLCDPKDYRLRVQARILDWVVFLFSRGSSGMLSSQTYNFSPKERRLPGSIYISRVSGGVENWLQKVVRYIKVWMDANLF